MNLLKVPIDVLTKQVDSFSFVEVVECIEMLRLQIENSFFERDEIYYRSHYFYVVNLYRRLMRMRPLTTWDYLQDVSINQWIESLESEDAK